MIVMPCYGVKMNKIFVQETQLLENTNSITSCSSDFNEYFLNGQDFNKTELTKMDSIKSKMKSVLEVLMKRQNQMICQNLFMSKKSFLLQL